MYYFILVLDEVQETPGLTKTHIGIDSAELKEQAKRQVEEYVSLLIYYTDNTKSHRKRGKHDMFTGLYWIHFKDNVKM